MIRQVSAQNAVVLSVIAAILSLSLLSLGFILHLCVKSRTSRSHHLQRFNSLWAVRSLLVLFITLWALTHLLRHVTNTTEFLCKLHVALSLGLFEPAFLVALLFLVHVSAQEHDKSTSSPNGRMALASVLATCLPIFSLQVLVLFFLSGNTAELFNLPPYFWRSSYGGDSTVVCSYPLLSTLVFGLFGIGYSFLFLASAGRVVSLVINKALRKRINGLVFAVLVSLTAQIVLLGLSVLFRPNEPAYDVVSLVVFLATFGCAAVGEGVLVIKPIADSLAVWGVGDIAARGTRGGDRRLEVRLFRIIRWTVLMKL